MIELPERNAQMRINKLFLLVFHGGLVCYLTLHNLIMPLVKNLGQGAPWNTAIRYYFVPHFVLFFYFFKCKFDDSKNNSIFSWLVFLITIVVFAAIFVTQSIKKGATSTDFSDGISIISMTIFLLGYFLYFQKFFNTFPKDSIIKGVLGLLLGVLFSFGQELIYQPPIEDKNRGRPTAPKKMKSTVTSTIELPSSNFGQNHWSYPLGENKLPQLLPQETALIITNRASESLLLRIDLSKDESHWILKEMIKLSAGEKIQVLKGLKGLFKIYSPGHPNVPVTFLVKGSDKFTQGLYHLSKNKIEVEYGRSTPNL